LECFWKKHGNRAGTVTTAQRGRVLGWSVKKVYYLDDEEQWAAGYVVPHPIEGYEFQPIIFRPFTERGLASVLNWCAYLNGGGPRPSGTRARYRPEELRNPPREPEEYWRSPKEQSDGIVLSAVSNKRKRESLEEADRPKRTRKKKGPTRKKDQDDG
jgi:hypothetical protein